MLKEEEEAEEDADDDNTDGDYYDDAGGDGGDACFVIHVIDTLTSPTRMSSSSGLRAPRIWSLWAVTFR